MAGARTGSDLPLAGRVRERAELERAVTDARLGSSRVLVISGEPGIGKTSLLRYAADLGRSDGMELLTARGIESEAEVPFGGLLELLRPALDELDRIPAAQAEALRSALDLGPTVERDRFVIGAATLNLLSARSERAPLLVLVDDAHWLDDSSLSAILFAARRLLVDPVAVVFAVRGGGASALEAAGLPQLPLAGLDAQAAAELVARHAGAQPSDVVERLARVTGGNPLALVELARRRHAARAWTRRGAARARDERRGRLWPPHHRPAGALGPGARARCRGRLARPHSGRIGGLRARALALADLEPAEQAELVSIAYGALTWRHPLVRAAAYRAVPPAERRAMHAALAGPCPRRRGPPRLAPGGGRARPRRGGGGGARGAARRARSRSAYAAAASAAERAAKLSAATRRRVPGACSPRPRRRGSAARPSARWPRCERGARARARAAAAGRDPAPARPGARSARGDVMAGHDVLRGRRARPVEEPIRSRRW